LLREGKKKAKKRKKKRKRKRERQKERKKRKRGKVGRAKDYLRFLGDSSEAQKSRLR